MIPAGDATEVATLTYSIVARDPATGQLGVAVQSKYFSVGSVVSWAEPGVGAVATQSMAEITYGPRGLELMRAGRSASDALAELLAEDELRDRRQVGMVDASGGVTSHTGSGCIDAAGDTRGDGFSCQANLMLNDTVWGAMARAYQSAPGELPDRLLAALNAAEAEGGDLRGRQSVAIVVVGGDSSLPPWRKELELRVEDHPDPLGEIRRLLGLRRAYDRVDQAEDALLKGGDPAAALRDLEEFAALNDANIDFTRAIGLALTGRSDEARALVTRLAAVDPGWKVAARRYADAGVIPDEVGLVAALTPAD
ncbi:MAG TPA: DUF1028 domain-containing protein [Candidatus Dormibacteraeota bacterium]|nr:DUF1028 domain-containing protein [Candidatus Dormibacteraeota bacterium]